MFRKKYIVMCKPCKNAEYGSAIKVLARNEEKAKLKADKIIRRNTSFPWWVNGDITVKNHQDYGNEGDDNN